MAANGRAAAIFLNTQLAGIVCSFAIGLKFRFGFDDSLDFA
jgi:hypothetical protein